MRLIGIYGLNPATPINQKRLQFSSSHSKPIKQFGAFLSVGMIVCPSIEAIILHQLLIKSVV